MKSLEINWIEKTGILEDKDQTCRIEEVNNNNIGYIVRLFKKVSKNWKLQSAQQSIVLFKNVNLFKKTPGRLSEII